MNPIFLNGNPGHMKTPIEATIRSVAVAAAIVGFLVFLLFSLL